MIEAPCIFPPYLANLSSLYSILRAYRLRPRISSQTSLFWNSVKRAVSDQLPPIAAPGFRGSQVAAQGIKGVFNFNSYPNINLTMARLSVILIFFQSYQSKTSNAEAMTLWHVYSRD